MFKVTKLNGVVSFVNDEYLDDVVESTDVVEEVQPITERPPPTAEEEQAMEATQYSRDRAAAYSRLIQDELRYDDLVNGTTTWPDAIAAIKQRFPK